MKFKILIVTVFFFTTVLTNAQTDFRPGYVVKTNGDTLKGEIDYRGDILMGEVCRFKPDNTDKDVTFTADDINEYRFNGSKYFVSKEVNGQNVFLEFLIKGNINIYVHKDAGGDHFFIEKTGLGLSGLPYEEGIIYKENTPYEYRSSSHTGILNIYTQDAPEFQTRISKMYKPKKRWLIGLAEDYQKIVCKNEDCIIFEKKLPFIKVNLEVVAGVNYSKGVEEEFYFYIQDANTKNQFYFQGGVLANFWLPGVNEKLYFRTGILYTTFKNEMASKTYYKIPVEIEYIYPKGPVRPKLAYGINLYKPFNYTVAFMPGVNITITKSVSFELNINADFKSNYKFALLPDKLYSYGILTGLYINL